MKNLLKTYTDSISQIFKNFELEGAYGEIDIRTESKWIYEDDEVRWLESECLYSNNVIRKPCYYQNYTMFYVDNGCGDRYYQIFCNDLIDKKI